MGGYSRKYKYSINIEEEIFNQAQRLIEANLLLLKEDPQLTQFLETLNQHSDLLYAHSLGVSFYSVMIAQQMGWVTPANMTKIAMAGLFHDIGKKDSTSD